MEIPYIYYLVVSGIMFFAGVYGFIVRRNMLAILISLELMLNAVDINFVVDERTNRVVVMGAIDNLVKGAAGQAVQNMNLIMGLDEMEGLKMPPMFP